MVKFSKAEKRRRRQNQMILIGLFCIPIVFLLVHFLFGFPILISAIISVFCGLVTPFNVMLDRMGIATEPLMSNTIGRTEGDIDRDNEEATNELVDTMRIAIKSDGGKKSDTSVEEDGEIPKQPPTHKGQNA